MLGFALQSFEGERLKNSLDDFEPRSILSFNIGTGKTLFEEHDMIEQKSSFFESK